MLRGVCALIVFLPAVASDSGVAIRVTVERLTDGHWSAVDPHLVLHGGDEVRFRFHSNRAGYLYVINHDAQGHDTWLFPTPDSGEENAIEANKDYMIPATAGVFQIAAHPGYETTYWIVSPEELRGRKTLTTANPDTAASDRTPLLPRCGTGSLTARGNCTDHNAGAHRSAVAIPKWFDNPGGLQARDLNVENTKEHSRISMSTAFSAPFIYEFRIAHQ